MTKRWLLAFSLFVLCGCGPAGPRYFDVSGVVNLDGKGPLPKGEILFEPEPTASHAYGPDHGRIENGAFQFKVKEGKHKVRITADAPIPGTRDMYGQPLVKNYLAHRFNTDTTLTADVGEGKTRFSFDVESGK